MLYCDLMYIHTTQGVWKLVVMLSDNIYVGQAYVWMHAFLFIYIREIYVCQSIMCVNS